MPEEAWTADPVLDRRRRRRRRDHLDSFLQKGPPEVRLIIRRVKPTPGSQLALFSTYDYHAFITDREGATLFLEADHRRHAVIEDVIRDLKYGVGLNHLPSGRFGANAAWMTLNVIAHNLGRWVGGIGLGQDAPPMTTKTLRTRFPQLAGPPDVLGRQDALFTCPTAGPWRRPFNEILANLRPSPGRASARVPEPSVMTASRPPRARRRRRQTLYRSLVHRGPLLSSLRRPQAPRGQLTVHPD